MEQILLKFKNMSRNLKIIILASLILLLLAGYGILRERKTYINYPFYETLLKNNQIRKAKIVDNEEVFLYTDKRKIYVIIKDGIDIKKLSKTIVVEIYHRSKFWDYLMLGLIFMGILFIFAILAKYMEMQEKKKGKEGEKNRKIKQIQPNELNMMSGEKIKPAISYIKFKDVAGIKEVKDELNEIVDFLKNPKKYKNYGITLPKGVLLVGPPGVGKTMIAKAVAGEADVPFFYQSGASFVQIYVGMGAKRVRELFSHAKKYAPSIIFIDEIDAVGKSRGNRNEERESTLNQLLTEMDGFEDSSGVIVIAATNQLEVIDEALLRAGRFDRRVFLGFPDIIEREKILQLYMKNKIHFTDLKKVAKMTVGFNGASLATLVNEATINTLKRDSKVVELEDFIAIKDKVLFGKKRIISFLEEEKEIQATYQSAKAICAYWFEVEFDKISLISASGLKELDREITSKTQMLAKLKVYLSGFVACKIIYNEVFSNSQKDLSKAKDLAKNMIEIYGMGENIISSNSEIVNLINTNIDELENFLIKLKDLLFKIRAILIKEESITKIKVKEILEEKY